MYEYNNYHKNRMRPFAQDRSKGVGVFNYIKKEKKLERRRNENSSNHAANGGRAFH
jgi:hypothetical protein